MLKNVGGCNLLKYLERLSWLYIVEERGKKMGIFFRGFPLGTIFFNDCYFFKYLSNHPKNSRFHTIEFWGLKT